MRPTVPPDVPDHSLDPSCNPPQQANPTPHMNYDYFHSHVPHMPNINLGAVPDMYSNYFASFPDANLSVPLNTTSYSFPLSEAPVDALNSLHHHILEIDPTTRDHADEILPHGYTSLQTHFSSAQVYSPHDHAHSESPVNSPEMSAFPVIYSSTPMNGPVHTMLPPMTLPYPADQFEPETRSFNQRVANTGSTTPDPYAADFLQQQLGQDKWNIFSARLAERRLGQPKSKSRMRRASTYFSDSKGGATSVDFLIKVEVVKEILRTYVPHPYNPLKSLSHPFPGSPTGSVTLARSTVLVLSGWSNTQFSYWARRAEAIAVLGQYDDRLSAVGAALERRLRGECDLESECLLSPVENSNRSSFSREDLHLGITGKGLDIIIDEVKKRTGASQFFRGKHSSLDPYVLLCVSSEEKASNTHSEVNFKQGALNATFQAVAYMHSPPPGVVSSTETTPKRRGRARRVSQAESQKSFTSDTQDTENEAELAFHVGLDDMTRGPCASSSSSAFAQPLLVGEANLQADNHAPLPSLDAPMNTSVSLLHRHLKSPNNPKSRLPVSDSRSEETLPKRKCVSSSVERPLQKRMK